MKQVLEDYCWFCDFGAARRLIHALGGLALIALGGLILWGTSCALAALPFGVPLLMAARLAWRKIHAWIT